MVLMGMENFLRMSSEDQTNYSLDSLFNSTIVNLTFDHLSTLNLMIVVDAIQNLSPPQIKSFKISPETIAFCKKTRLSLLQDKDDYLVELDKELNSNNFIHILTLLNTEGSKLLEQQCLIGKAEFVGQHLTPDSGRGAHKHRRHNENLFTLAQGRTASKHGSTSEPRRPRLLPRYEVSDEFSHCGEPREGHAHFCVPKVSHRRAEQNKGCASRVHDASNQLSQP